MKRGQQDFFTSPSGYDDPGAAADAAVRAVRMVAERLSEFTTDEVAEQLTDWTIAEPRLLGPAMLRARAAGWIEPTNRVQPTRNRAAHSRPKAIWRSRLVR